MISKLENPPLMVVAGIRFHDPLGPFFLFGGRWRRFRQALTQSPGLLLYQEVALRPGLLLVPRTFLALSWWQDRESLKAWYNHPQHRKMIKWGEDNQRRLDVWIEEYILREPGQYLGAPGGLKAALEERGIELRKAPS